MLCLWVTHHKTSLKIEKTFQFLTYGTISIIPRNSASQLGESVSVWIFFHPRRKYKRTWETEKRILRTLIEVNPSMARESPGLYVLEAQLRNNVVNQQISYLLILHFVFGFTGFFLLWCINRITGVKHFNFLKEVQILLTDDLTVRANEHML